MIPVGKWTDLVFYFELLKTEIKGRDELQKNRQNFGNTEILMKFILIFHQNSCNKEV